MKTDMLARDLYRDLKELVIAEEMYREIVIVGIDPIDRALEKWKRAGGVVTVIPYRKSRKSERVIRVGVKN